ncbi:metallophosphoesterase family protein [Marivita hallyeonensis]|uniref:Predicted phosphodiesterase n=1 Tax=Marivita hallyeonensis TaxID=996342 RepID=A0A1M5Y1N0_9RHOB|nr:metallophosphoesterase family protein [Marivita hallyeonensis]SHI05985.1 Predicted phosphodiesterase [Marivita hallyeonensis]
MKFAVLADIHGNSDALKAVFADMDALGLTDAVNLGDHFSGPLDAHGTAELLMSRDFPSIRGNHDRWLIEKTPEDMGPSDRVAYDQLRPEHLDWLRTLSPTLTVFEDVFLCHGTPASDLAYWLERVEDDGTIRASTRAEIEAEAQGIDASLILCAHTHVPRVVRLTDGRVVLNPGSVGCPGYDDDHPVYHEMQTGTPNASYAIAEQKHAGWLITFRSVPYDPRGMVALAKAQNRPEWARAVGTGWVSA